MNSKYYIYAHIRLDTNTVFYIGKGSEKRAEIKANRTEHWKRIANKHGYKITVLESNLSEENAFAKEMEYIKLYKTLNQCEANFSMGGKGINIENRWWGQKISASLMGLKRPKGKDNKNYKDFLDRETLYDLYIVQNLSSMEIEKRVNVTYATICNRLKEYNIPIRPAGRKKLKIKCTNDGRVFNSQQEAADFYGVFRENIRKVLKGIYKNTGNKHFEYYEEE